MKRLDSVKGAVDKALVVACIALFMILVLVVSWQVFTRQVLDAPSQWSETLSRYLFVWVGFLGAALVFGERGHLAIDVGVRLLPKAPQKIVGVVVQLVVAAFSGYILIWGGWRAAMNAWNQNLSGLPTSVGPWYLVLPLAGILIVLYSIYHSVRVVTGSDDPFSGEDEEANEAVAAYGDVDEKEAAERLRTESVEDDPDGTDVSHDKDKE